jgi:hypothetical protein
MSNIRQKYQGRIVIAKDRHHFEAIQNFLIVTDAVFTAIAARRPLELPAPGSSNVIIEARQFGIGVDFPLAYPLNSLMSNQSPIVLLLESLRLNRSQATK